MWGVSQLPLANSVCGVALLDRPTTVQSAAMDALWARIAALESQVQAQQETAAATGSKAEVEVEAEAVDGEAEEEAEAEAEAEPEQETEAATAMAEAIPAMPPPAATPAQQVAAAAATATGTDVGDGNESVDSYSGPPSGTEEGSDLNEPMGEVGLHRRQHRVGVINAATRVRTASTRRRR